MTSLMSFGLTPASCIACRHGPRVRSTRSATRASSLALVSVAVGRLDLEDSLADLENRDVEGSTAQVVDGDRLVLLLVETVGQRRRGRLVDDTQHFETGHAAGVLGRLPLAVVEVGGHGDDGLGDLL